jgi:hypothetical protein
MDVDRSDLVVDLEDEEISVISVDISSGDESNFGSDDEEDDEDVSGKPSNCELIKKHKREHHVGDSPIFLERSISFFNTGTNIDQAMKINDVIDYLKRMSSHPPTLLSSYIDKVKTLHKNNERLIWYHSIKLFDHVPVNIHGDGFDTVTSSIAKSFQSSIEVNIPWLIKMLVNFRNTFGEIYDRIMYIELLQCFANYMIDNKKGCLAEPKRNGSKWVKRQDNSSDNNDPDEDDKTFVGTLGKFGPSPPLTDNAKLSIKSDEKDNTPNEYTNVDKNEVRPHGKRKSSGDENWGNVMGGVDNNMFAADYDEDTLGATIPTAAALAEIVESFPSIANHSDDRVLKRRLTGEENDDKEQTQLQLLGKLCDKMAEWNKSSLACGLRDQTPSNFAAAAATTHNDDTVVDENEACPRGCGEKSEASHGEKTTGEEECDSNPKRANTKGVVYFAWIDVPDEVLNMLSEDQRTFIYQTAVKVGESWDDLYRFWRKMKCILFYHPKATLCWVCIGIPLGMNSYVIEQFVHFKHESWFIGGEYYLRKILAFIDELCRLIDAHIIHMGKFVNDGTSRNGNYNEKPGHLYAFVRDFEEDELEWITKIIEESSCDTVHEYFYHLLRDTKVGYTTKDDYSRFQNYRWAHSRKNIILAITDTMTDNGYAKEQLLHNYLSEQKWFNEWYTFKSIGQIRSKLSNFVKNVINETTIEIKCQKLKGNSNAFSYPIGLVLEFIQLGLMSVEDVEDLLRKGHFIVHN